MAAPSYVSRKSPDATVQDIKRSLEGSRHLPYWTAGSLHYGKTLGRVNKQFVDSSSELVLSSIGQMSLKRDGVFTVADYGGNDGHASMDLVAGIVGLIRQRCGQDRPVQVIYEDQEQNDFNSLFARLSGDDNSPTARFPNVFPLATNLNFYKQCVPDTSCDVIFSSFSTHWRESYDVNFKDAIYHGSPHVTRDELRRFLVKGAEDWEKFLLLRAKELKPGGLLILLSLSRADGFAPSLLEDNSTATNGGSEPLMVGKVSGDSLLLQRVGTSNRDTYRDLETAWRQLKDERIIEKGEYEKCIYNTVVRSSKEITAPFERQDSRVVQAGLSLVSHDQIVLGQLLETLRWDLPRTQGREDRDCFAQRLAEIARVFSHSSFEAALSSGRSDQQRAAILDQLYDRFRSLVAGKDPSTYMCDHIVSRLVVKKC